jgi:hypothetical protein
MLFAHRPQSLALATVLALFFVTVCERSLRAEERLDEEGATSTQLALLHERWWAWEAARPAVEPTEVEGPRSWIKLQLSGVRNRASDWVDDSGFSLLKDRDSYGKSRYTMATGALATKWGSFYLRARVGRPEMSAGLRPRRHAPAFGITVPWQQFTFELEALDDKEFGYSVLTGLRWSHPNQRVQYGVALPLSIGDGPSVAAILQVLIRLDDPE